MIAGFYQLARRPVEAVVPSLVKSALAAGHRLLIRSDDAALLARLDEALWSHSRTSFLPHGHDASLPKTRHASQPVLLSQTLPAANAADCLLQLQGDVPEDPSSWKRLLYLFGEEDVETARAHRRRLKAMPNVQPVFWREAETGGFEKVA